MKRCSEIVVMPDQPEKEQEPSPEFQRFDNFMRKLARVPIAEVQKLDAEQKQAKAKKGRGDRGTQT